MSDAVVMVRRTIATPLEQVFDAWIDAEQARGFLFATSEGEIVRCDIDARVGGGFLIIDRRPDGDAEHHGRFEAIDRPRRLVFLFRGPGTEPDEWSGDRRVCARRRRLRGDADPRDPRDMGVLRRAG